MGLLARIGFGSREIATPATPASGSRLLYPKTSGWYEKDSAGVERLLTHAIEPYIFAVTGPLAAATGKSRVYLEGSYLVETVRASVNTSPAGSAITVDVNKNGTTIYTTQSARPSIAAAANSATGNSPAIANFDAGDYMTVDIDTVGSSDPGADLTVVVRLRKI